MRRRSFGMPLAALAASWLFLVSMPLAPSEQAPPADLHTGLAWGSPTEVASSGSFPDWSRLVAGPSGAFCLFYEADGLWQLGLDDSGRPLSSPRLLGRESPTYWATTGKAPYFAQDASGNIWNVWDNSGTDIHIRKTDARGAAAISDRVLRSNAYGAHGASVAVSPDGIVVGYTSYEPTPGGYRFVLARLDGSGQVASEMFFSPDDGALLQDGVFLASPDGHIQLVLSSTSGGTCIEVDSAGMVLSRLAVPLLQGGALPVMARGADGTLFLAWKAQDEQGKGRIAACRILGQAAASIYITAPDESLTEPSLAIQPGGEALLCWLRSRNDTGEAMYAVVDPDGWAAYPATQKLANAASPSDAPSPAVSFGRTFSSWPSGASVRVSRGYSFGFVADSPPAPARVRPHLTSEMTVRLQNRGGLADTLSLSLDATLLPTGWSAALSTGELALPAGDGLAQLRVFLTGPADGGGPSGGLLRVRVTSAGNPRLGTVLDVPVELEVRCQTESTLSPQVASGAPGTAVPFELLIRNLGDLDEELMLSGYSGPLLSVALDRSLLRVAWSGTATVGVRASVSPLAAVGDALELSVLVRSLDSGKTQRIDATVVVSPGVVLRLSSEMPAKAIYPGGSVDFTVAVQNDGSSPGPADIFIEIVSGSAGWTASVEPAFLQLATKERADVHLSVFAPLRASGRFVVRVLATSRDWSTQASTTVTAMAIPIHGLQASSPVSGAGGPPGAPLFLPLTATNTGTETEDTVLALELPSGWSGRTLIDGAYADSASILPGGSVRWTAQVSSPPDARAGEYALRAVLSGRSGASATVDLAARVDPMHDLLLVSPTTSIRGAPGEPAAAVVHLRNLGNSGDRFTLSTAGPPGWTASVRNPDDGSEGPVELGPGSSADLVLEARVPFSAPDSWSEIAVVATSESGLRAQLMFRIGLLLPDLSVGVSYSPARFSAGRPSLATVTVTNTGEAPARNVQVSFDLDGSSARSERIQLIPAGSSKTATFIWTPAPGRHLLRFEADPEHTVLERDEGNNLFLERVSIEGAAAPATASTAPLVVAAAGGTTLVLLLGAFGGGTEYGKYWLVSLLFVPLYTKIKKDDVLDHFVRGQVYGYIKANPGEHYNSIKKALALKNGTLVYHLKTLEREEFIKSIIDGRFKRFYPREMKVPEPSDELVLRMNHIQHEILKIIRENPGISQKEIAGRIGLSTPTVHYHINIMLSGRIINVKRVGRETQCYVEEMEDGRAG